MSVFDNNFGLMVASGLKGVWRMTREIGNMVPRSGVVFTKGEARPLTAR
jgi:hypothetical protein